MATAFDQQPNDLGVLQIDPASQTDPRVPIAAEFYLDSMINAFLYRSSRLPILGWKVVPSITVTAPLTLNITGIGLLPGCPVDVVLNNQVNITPLNDTISTVKRTDYLSLVSVIAEIGAAQDPILGQVSFRYRSPTDGTIVPVQKENSRRLRSLWMIILSAAAPLTTTQLLGICTQDGLGNYLINTPVALNNNGNPSGNLQIYFLDPSWTVSNSYKIFPKLIDILPIANINRLQNFLDSGYIWGNGGEESLNMDYTVKPFKQHQNNDIDSRVRDRIYQLFSGKGPKNRAVLNFGAGQVLFNPGKPGTTAGSPNGSICLGATNRIHYFNQAVTQKLGTQLIVAGNDGKGNALLTFPIGNFPANTSFSENITNHKIYTLAGDEISTFGSFLGLGGIGALNWVADATQKILPGQSVYFVPGINIPAGSGFTYPFDTIESAWRGDTGALVSQQNILRGDSQDLSAYQTPANNETFFIVFSEERSGIIYIYKYISITTNTLGIAIIPQTETGCFAFIEGVLGRLDVPVVKGLSPSTIYNALIYYAPKSQETWQFQIQYPIYQSDTEPTFLNGATIISAPLLFCHTQGGGNYVFESEGLIRYKPIASYLPALEGDTPYLFNQPVQLNQNPTVSSFTETSFIFPVEMTAPTVGAIIQLQATAINHSKSLMARLTINGIIMGFNTPLLANNTSYQAVLVFAIMNHGQQKLVVVTRNGPGGEVAPLDADHGTAIGLFPL